jgi:putative sugar O-methyltransferase
MPQGEKMVLGQITLKVFSYIRKYLYWLRMIPSQARLARIKRVQRNVFHVLCGDFPKIYGKLKKYDISKFTTPVWEQLNAKIESTLLPYPGFSFLRDPLIRTTMVIADFGQVLKQELTMLEKKYSEDRLKVLLEEDYVGGPIIINSKYLTSHNSIHHLFHLTKYLNKAKFTIDEISTVVEWGGGYGNLAKIFKRLNLVDHTYIIIDTPLFSSIQWLYLSTILGKENVNLLQSSKDIICPGKINLIPICFLDDHQISADLFISTWALSESSPFSQDYVVAHEWFKSKHLLLAYHKSTADYLPSSDRIGALAGLSGALIEEIDFLPCSFYAFR